MALVDLLSMTVALLAALVITELTVGPVLLFHRPAEALAVFYHLGLMGVAVLRFNAIGHYSKRRPFWDQLHQVLLVVLVLALLEATLLFLTREEFSRPVLLLSWSLSALLIPLGRFGYMRWQIRRGRWHRPTVILGCGPNALEAAEALREEPFLAHDVAGFISMPGEEVPAGGYVELKDRCVPVVRIEQDPVAMIRALGSPAIVVAMENGALERFQAVLRRLFLHCRNITVVPTLRGLPMYGMETNHVFRHEVLLLNVRNNLAHTGSRLMKRSVDLVGSALLLVLLSPLFGWIAWRVRQTGKGIFFGHRRVGMQGKPFRCYKFRTMVPNAKEVLEELLERDEEARAEWERDFKLKDDPRITPIGHFLRRTSLDELPQLWNVLKGEMSLVGPRPIVEEEIERYRDDIDYYLGVRPGITGLWQVSGRNDIDYASRVQLDAWYVRNWSLWGDIVILLHTVRVVLARSGAY